MMKTEICDAEVGREAGLIQKRARRASEAREQSQRERCGKNESVA
jgi:hypothetical protein